MRVHPAFDVTTRTWFTDGAEAPTLAGLAAQLPPGTIIEGYYPDGFRDEIVIRPPPPRLPAPNADERGDVRNHISVRAVKEKVAKAPAGTKLTQVERQILAMLIARPVITREGVVAATGCQPSTVKVLVSNIRKKAGVAITADELGWRMSEEAKAEIAERMLRGGA